MTSELGSLSWVEFSQRAPSVKLAVIPTGSTEQHGPNMSFATDTLIATELARRVCAELQPAAIVVPPVPWGISDHHMAFKGTLTLRPDTLAHVLVDISRSLAAHGIKKVMVLNGHGGNQAAISNAGCMARSECGVEIANVMHFSLIRPATLQRVTSLRWGHACEVEVSLAMFLCPEAVKKDSLAPGELREYPYRLADPASRSSRISVPYRFEELTANGALGNACLASTEFGEQLASDIIEGCVDFARSFIGANNPERNNPER